MITGNVSYKLYKCSTCDDERKIATNHWGDFYGWCPSCGWRQPMETQIFKCQEPLPEGYESQSRGTRCSLVTFVKYDEQRLEQNGSRSCQNREEIMESTPYDKEIALTKARFAVNPRAVPLEVLLAKAEGYRFAKEEGRETGPVQPSKAMKPEEIETLRILLELSLYFFPSVSLADDWFLLGNAYYLTGQRNKALICYGCALNLQPNFPEVMAALDQAKNSVVDKQEQA